MVTEEKREPTMGLEFDKIPCDGLCKKSYDSNNIFICKHIDCANDVKIYCQDCGAFAHKMDDKIQHKFDPAENHMLSVESLYKPDESKYKVKSYLSFLYWGVYCFIILHRMQEKEQRL